MKNETVPFDPYRKEILDNSSEPFFIPLLTHQPINHPQIVQFLTSASYLEDFKAFIITSQRCIESLDIVLESIKDDNLRRKILSKPAYTVGPATFEVLSNLGFTDIRGGIKAGNGSILSDIIISDKLFESGDKNILFLTGEIRKDIIPKKLTSAGFNIKELVAYRTDVMDDVVERYSSIYEKVKTESKDSNVDNWIVFFSPQGTEYITKHLVCHKSDFKIASIGPTTESYLLENGIKPDFVAKKPNAESLIQGILNL